MAFGVPMEKHAADCVNLAMTWYNKEAMALNEDIDPTDDLIQTIAMCELLTPRYLKGDDRRLAREFLYRKARDVFGPLLRGDSEKRKEAIEQIQQSLSFGIPNIVAPHPPALAKPLI